MAMIFDIRCARPASRWDAMRPRALPRGEALLALVPMEEEEGRRHAGAPEGAHAKSHTRVSHRATATPAEPELAQDTTSTDPSAAADATPRATSAAAAAAAAAAGSARRPTAPPSAGTAVAEQPREAERDKPARSQRAERAADRRRQSQGGAQRRRQPPRRAPLPAAKRELLISVDVGEQRVAVVEDDRVAEVYLERPERRSIAGNIYLGVVDNVLPGMEAAFVEIGLEKNGFLYVDEIVVPELEGKRHGKKIQDLISRGEQLLVQAVKDPMKSKGARLTTEISLPGRFLVYVPNGEGLGVSRRLDDAERTRLKEIIKDLEVKEGGVIVRTAADGASAEDIERDLVFLQRLWKTIQARAKNASAPMLVYQEAELPLRIVRDLFAGDFVGAHVDNERTHKRIVSYLKKTSPHMIERVHRYREKEPLFESRGVEKEIASTLDRRVDLPSGGYLVFDYAEAFTVVDVNTGRFVGSRSKSSNQRLEDTITKNNLEAVKEVVRQLRLRDIGGIIVIDFIDMANPKNRASVEDALRQELERDRTKTYVVEISPLGLVEMTRQNVTDGPREILTRKCPTCGGDGIVVSDHTIAMQVERKLRALASPGNRVQAYRVELHPRVLELVAGPGGTRLAAIEEATKRRFFLVPVEGHAHADHFEVLAEGKLVDLQPESPVAEGSTVELKLGEFGRYDASTGRREGGRDRGARRGRREARREEGEGNDRARAGRAGVRDARHGRQAGDDPITFESEAEKPTRAPSRRKAATPAEAGAGDGDGRRRPWRSTPTPSSRSRIRPARSMPRSRKARRPRKARQRPTGRPRPAKKRTRRGSRGGRRRKKPTAGADASANGDATAAADARRRPRTRMAPEGVAEPANGAVEEPCRRGADRRRIGAASRASTCPSIPRPRRRRRR